MASTGLRLWQIGALQLCHLSTSAVYACWELWPSLSDRGLILPGVYCVVQRTLLFCGARLDTCLLVGNARRQKCGMLAMIN
jgi:hypothetical protein